jgi:hypothetical protein
VEADRAVELDERSSEAIARRVTRPDAAPVKAVERPPEAPRAKAPRPVEPVVESAAVPEPGAATEGRRTGNNPVVAAAARRQQFSKQDFNRDGHPEEVIEHRHPERGVIDFSIISQGRELFYGQGEQLRVLNQHHTGWPDLALVKPGDRVEVFRFDAQSLGYVSSLASSELR